MDLNDGSYFWKKLAELANIKEDKLAEFVENALEDSKMWVWKVLIQLSSPTTSNYHIVNWTLFRLYVVYSVEAGDYKVIEVSLVCEVGWKTTVAAEKPAFKAVEAFDANFANDEEDEESRVPIRTRKAPSMYQTGGCV